MSKILPGQRKGKKWQKGEESLELGVGSLESKPPYSRLPTPNSRLPISLPDDQTYPEKADRAEDR